jgi:L-threonylcarbamoyladenylate synthase
MRELLDQLHQGKVIGFATDTVPALATLPEHGEQIFSLKRRPLTKPLILLGADLEQLKPYVQRWKKEWEDLAHDGWPGPLTLILPASTLVPEAVHRGQKTVGLRVPARGREWLIEMGPLASTSANFSGQPPVSSKAEFQALFPEVLVLPGLYEQATGSPSTIVLWKENRWVLLREGPFSLPQSLKESWGSGNEM